MDPFRVNGVRVDRENAPAPDPRGAMGLPESKVGWVNDRFITDRRVPRYGVIVWCDRPDEIGPPMRSKSEGCSG